MSEQSKGSRFMVGHGRLSHYIDAAMAQASIRETDSQLWYGEVVPCPGAWAEGTTPEACRANLRAALETWIIVGLRHGDRLPIIDGIDLNPDRDADDSPAADEPDENSVVIRSRYDRERGAVVRMVHGPVNMTRGQAIEMYAAMLITWTQIVGHADAEMGPNGKGQSFFEETTARATAMQPVDFMEEGTKGGGG